MQTPKPKMSECQDPRCVARNQFNDTCATLGGALLAAFTLAVIVSCARGETSVSLVHNVILIATAIVAVVYSSVCSWGIANTSGTHCHDPEDSRHGQNTNHE